MWINKRLVIKFVYINREYNFYTLPLLKVLTDYKSIVLIIVNITGAIKSY